MLHLTLLCHSHRYLDLYSIDAEINREYLSRIIVRMKFEKALPNQTLLFDRTRLYTTEGRTKPLTDGQKVARGHKRHAEKLYLSRLQRKKNNMYHMITNVYAVNQSQSVFSEMIEKKYEK